MTLSETPKTCFLALRPSFKSNTILCHIKNIQSISLISVVDASFNLTSFNTLILTLNVHMKVIENTRCAFISSLAGKTLRMHNESGGLRSYSTCVLKAEPGKLDITRHEPGILLIRLQVDLLFKLAIMM